MANLHFIEDNYGDIVDVIVFCSDYCHREYSFTNSLDYGGWNGCNEISFSEPCAECGDMVSGLDEE
jgi:hypothetical protein